MIDNIIPVDQKYISENKLAEFDFDIIRWRSALKHMKNESVFITRTLTSDTFDARTENLTERLNTFRKHINTKITILNGFEIEISQYDQKLTTAKHSDNDITDSSWLEEHDSLKHRFEDFCKDFKAFRLNVLKYA